jgi:hypothetical protein
MAKKVKVFEPLTDVVPYQVKSGTGRKIVRQAQSQLAQMNYRENMVEAASTDAQRKQFHGVNKKGVNTTEIRGVGSVEKVQGAAPEGRDGPTKDWSELDRGRRIPENHIENGKMNPTRHMKGALKSFTSTSDASIKEHHKKRWLGFEKSFGTPVGSVRPCAGENCPNTVQPEEKNADVTCASCTANEKKLQNTGQLNSILNRKRR